MATTALIPIHAGKGRPITTALKLSTDYVKNPEKTDSGEWVTAYECDPLIADKEFMFSKSQYAAITGRSQGKRDVIAYHLRISFKPGETDAETANRIGYELAMKLTRGNHAFVCCTHTDKAHTHSHIVINSTSLDCTRKFRNFKNSAFAVRKIADLLCVENGLSIIEKPQPSKGKDYGGRQGKSKPPSNRDRLCGLIDNALCVGNSFGEFIVRMKQAGCSIKLGKNIAFKLPDAQRFIRLSSLGEGYTEDDINRKLAGLMEIMRKSNSIIPQKGESPRLWIEVENKIKAINNSPAFEHWASIYNLKAAAHTLIWVKDNGIKTYDELVGKTAAASKLFTETNGRIKEIGARQKELNELQRHIGTYGKTKEVYALYRRSGWDSGFYEVHRADITLHRAAKKHFNELGYGKDKKLPTIKTLREEWGQLEAEKKCLYKDYHSQKKQSRDLLTAKQNLDKLLGIKDEDLEKPMPEQTAQRTQKRRDYGAR